MKCLIFDVLFETRNFSAGSESNIGSCGLTVWNSCGAVHELAAWRRIETCRVCTVAMVRNGVLQK